MQDAVPEHPIVCTTILCTVTTNNNNFYSDSLLELLKYRTNFKKQITLSEYQGVCKIKGFLLFPNCKNKTEILDNWMTKQISLSYNGDLTINFVIIGIFKAYLISDDSPIPLICDWNEFFEMEIAGCSHISTIKKIWIEVETL